NTNQVQSTKLEARLPYFGHLLPEKLSYFGKRTECVSAFRVRSRRQSQFLGQLWIGRSDIFIAALARQPAIESTIHDPPLFDWSSGDKRAAQVVQVRYFKRIGLVIVAQRREKLFLAQKFSQRLEHQGAFTGNDRGILKRIAIPARGSARLHVVAAERAIDL